MHDRGQQLTVVSNRLPIVMNHHRDGWRVEAGSGGLVQAMNPILGDTGGCWVGWPGVTGEDDDGWRDGLAGVEDDCDYRLEPVVMSQEDYQGYYRGFANSVLWPLFHGFPDRCEFLPEFYDAYGRVNQKFADAVQHCHDDGFLWVHDYHLMQLARRLREQGGEMGPVGFFLHIPFPSVENYTKLPWGDELLADLLHYDIIGFQTERDLNNFERCVRRTGVRSVDTTTSTHRQFELGGRIVEAGAFPIGIDYDGFETRAASDEVAERMDVLKNGLGAQKVLLGVDRLDYSKGLLERLRGYERALERHPELHEEVVFFQLLVPSRESVPAYRELKRQFDRMVGRINGRFSTTSWEPIHYLYDSVRPPELSALYRLADVALVTSLRDGMNLVSKEYCASQVDDDGVLVLSEFAGSRGQLGDGAILVNPYDTDETADAIVRAVTMEAVERRRRMQKMRKAIADTDVFWWANSFIERIRSRDETVQTVISSERISMTGERAGSR